MRVLVNFGLFGTLVCSNFLGCDKQRRRVAIRKLRVPLPFDFIRSALRPER